MFKSLDSIASVVEIFMYPTSKYWGLEKGLDYNTGSYCHNFLPVY